MAYNMNGGKLKYIMLQIRKTKQLSNLLFELKTDSQVDVLSVGTKTDQTVEHCEETYLSGCIMSMQNIYTLFL